MLPLKNGTSHSDRDAPTQRWSQYWTHNFWHFNHMYCDYVATVAPKTLQINESGYICLPVQTLLQTFMRLSDLRLFFSTPLKTFDSVSHLLLSDLKRRNNAVTLVYDVTGWFLMISLSTNQRKHLKWDKYIHTFSRSVLLKEIRLRPLKTTCQPVTGFLLRSARSEAGCLWIWGFGRMILCRNVRWYIQFQVNALGSLLTPSFSSVQ